jgi:hypothetical protein
MRPADTGTRSEERCRAGGKEPPLAMDRLHDDIESRARRNKLIHV